MGNMFEIWDEIAFPRNQTIYSWVYVVYRTAEKCFEKFTHIMELRKKLHFCTGLRARHDKFGMDSDHVYLTFI